MHNRQRFHYISATQHQKLETSKSPRNAFYGSPNDTVDEGNGALHPRVINSESSEAKSEIPSDWIDQWNSHTNTGPSRILENDTHGRPMQLKCKTGWTAEEWTSSKSGRRHLRAKNRTPVSPNEEGEVTSDLSALKNHYLRIRSENALLYKKLRAQLEELSSEKQKTNEHFKIDDSHPDVILTQTKQLKQELEIKSQIAEKLQSTVSNLKNAQSVFSLTDDVKTLQPKTSQELQLIDSQGDVSDSLSPKAAQEKDHVGKYSSASEYQLCQMESQVDLLAGALEAERQTNQELVQENLILKSQVKKISSTERRLSKSLTSKRR